MVDEEKPVSSNAHLEDADDEDAGEESTGDGMRPEGGSKAGHAGAVGQHPDEMRERGTVDPDKPDPSGGAPG